MPHTSIPTEGIEHYYLVLKIVFRGNSWVTLKLYVISLGL
jgi:hypothetical protein